MISPKIRLMDALSQFRTAALFWNITVFGVPLLIFLRTVAPTVYGLDSAELTTGAYVLGIVHAPGSPLYLLLGHLFTWIPIGDVGYRLNLFSTFAAALTVWFVFRILLRLTQHHLIALMSAWYLAFTYYFWISALFAELYAMHACLMAALLWLALLWREQQQSWQLYMLAFGFGLSTGNHLSMVLLGPGFAWLTLFNTSAASWRQTGRLLTAIAFLFVGLMVYLYLPLRDQSNTALNYARDYWLIDLNTWSGFWWMVSGQMFGSLFFSVPPSELLLETRQYIHQLWSNFFGLGVVIGLIGCAVHFKKNPALHGGLLLMFCGHLFFYLTYGATDKELMFLPTFLIWGLWTGLGVAYLNQRLKDQLPYFGVLAITVLVPVNIFFNFGYVDLSHDWSARELGESILSQLETDAVYIGTWKDVPIIEYLQIVEDQRADVTPVQLFFTGPGKAKRIAYEKLSDNYPVYSSAIYNLDDNSFQKEYLKGCQCYQLKLTHQ